MRATLSFPYKSKNGSYTYALEAPISEVLLATLKIMYINQHMLLFK